MVTKEALNAMEDVLNKDFYVKFIVESHYKDTITGVKELSFIAKKGDIVTINVNGITVEDAEVIMTSKKQWWKFWK